MDALSIAQLPDAVTPDRLDQILLELRGIRLALVHMATQDGKAAPDDFDMTSSINDVEVISQLS